MTRQYPQDFTDAEMFTVFKETEKVHPESTTEDLMQVCYWMEESLLNYRNACLAIKGHIAIYYNREKSMCKMEVTPLGREVAATFKLETQEVVELTPEKKIELQLETISVINKIADEVNQK